VEASVLVEGHEMCAVVCAEDVATTAAVMTAVEESERHAAGAVVTLLGAEVGLRRSKLAEILRECGVARDQCEFVIPKRNGETESHEQCKVLFFHFFLLAT